MKSLLGLLVLVLRGYIIIKMVYTLFMVNQDPINHPINEVIWWSGFLIFDIWLSNMLPPLPTETDKDENHLDNFRK